MGFSSSETLAFVVEAKKKTEALPQVEAELTHLGNTASRVAQQVNSAGQSTSRFQQVAGNPKMREGANAMMNIAFAAQAASLGGKEAIASFGALASTIAATAGTAKMAALASGIGAVVVVLGTLVSLWEKLNAETEADKGFLKKIADMPLAMGEGTLKALDVQIAAAQAKIADSQSKMAALVAGAHAMGMGGVADLVERVAEKTTKASRDLELLQANRKALDEQVTKQRTDRDRQAADQERQRQIADAKTAADLRLKLADEVLTEEAKLSANAIQQKRLAAERAFADEKRGIEGLHVPQRTQNELIQQAWDRRQAILATIEEERQKLERNAQLALQGLTGGDDPAAQYRVRMEQIAAERQAQLDSGVAVATADATAQAKIRAQRQATLKQAGANAKELTDIMIQSGSRQVRAVGHAADSIRRVLIGADAARAAVHAAIEGAAAIASAAAMDFRGAALHASSAVAFAAAAAKGAQESLGGGGGGASAGGGGAGGGGTFEPTPRAGGGGVTLNLITRDPYGRDAIAQTIYELDRANTLKRPIPIAPTTGLVPVGA